MLSLHIDGHIGKMGLHEALIDEFVKEGDVEEDMRDELREILMRKHVHQYEQAKKNGPNGDKSGFLSTVRSISDIGKSFSHGKNLSKLDKEQAPLGPQLELPKVESMPRDMSKDGSNADISKGNTHFMKKLPHGVEASNVLIGEVDFLQRHICAFIRLKTANLLGDLTEVPVPTRFIFLMLGPTGHAAQYREIGRAIATLMADEIFHDVAYKARNKEDLIDGVDEFLDQASNNLLHDFIMGAWLRYTVQVTVLPPGEWDPTIRIEPPNQIPSQEKRKQVGQELLLENVELSKGKTPGKDELEEEEGHGNDPALRRTGRLCGGLILDIKRKAPHYLSDFTDALNLQCLATTCFMYFALLAPIVTFGGLLEEATHQRMAAMENLFGGAICGVVYHLFSGQPLTIIGSTGPVLVFETIVYDFCLRLGIKYLSFRFWVHVWTGFIIFLMCITDASSLVSYITRFTEESFATLIAVIFIYEAIMKLWKIKNQLDVINYSREIVDGTCFCTAPVGKPLVSIEKAGELIKKSGLPIAHNETFIDYSAATLENCRMIGGTFGGTSCYALYDKILMSILLTIGTFCLAITFKKMRNSCYFPSRIRQLFSDFAVMISIAIMTSLDMVVGINTPKLNVPSSFRPTWDGRGWIVPPFDGNPFWTVPLAAIPALLACILIFMDQQITTVIVNRKENKLKKGCGYHLDLLVLAVLIWIVGFLGLPIYVAATVLSINHINSLKVESECKAPGEVAQFVGVREQRVTGIITFLMIGLSVLMTGILGRIPMPVLYGVFLYMGISALGGIQLFDRILLLLMPMKYQPDTIYIRHVPIKKIHLFTAFQVGCLAVLWTVKSIKSTSISFPIMLVVMVAVRKLMEKFFTKTDLKYLDDPMPDFHLRKKEDLKRRQSEGEPVDIELEENQATIHAVKTEAHLHIPMASGNVIKIPLAAIQEPSHSINMTKEVNSSGMWKHISSRDSRNSLNKEMPKNAYQPDTIYIRHVPIKKIHLFTAFQVGCLAVLWTVKSIKSTSISFPIMLVVMVAVRKLMEKFFTKTDLKYLDDPMPDFHLRKKEDLKRRQSEGEPVDIELEENQATIHAVKTEAHLHIPMASGNVIKIPLAAIQEPSHSINMTKEVNSSGMWKHISSRDSRNSLNKEMPKNA
ncbi:anion exchange protein [Oesophagostomum dentatum]|uniref:Anion exchange protein n=1 Tax=Oesophagostomum dentatum TaxID=61180 RepID=A0A0B1SWF5_OESDE|nr:anion exchange protein [Oesophagostomum dentatum]